MVDEDWKRRLRDRREHKDEFFAESERSPVPDEASESFDGLRYFPPAPDLRFELPLDEHDDPEPLTVETTTGGERHNLRWGEFTFEVASEVVT